MKTPTIPVTVLFMALKSTANVRVLSTERELVLPGIIKAGNWRWGIRIKRYGIWIDEVRILYSAGSRSPGNVALQRVLPFRHFAKPVSSQPPVVQN